MAAGDLTTTALVQQHGQVVGNATALAQLVTEVSQYILMRLGKAIESATYTEYYDGRGRDTLILNQGPLGSVTSLNSVAYSDDGANGRAETLTEIYAYEFVVDGTLASGYLKRGKIELLSGYFSPGRQNYKVVYVGGFTSIPAAIQHAATVEVLTRWNQRQSLGYSQKEINDAETRFLSPKQQDDALWRAISPYAAWAVS